MSLILSIPFNNSIRNIGLQKKIIVPIPEQPPVYCRGPFGNDAALELDGSTYWKSQGITLGAEATICFWSKTSTNGKMPWVLESNASNILCLYESTYYTLNTGDGNANLFKTESNASISVLRDNVWHHFAVTFGDGVAKLYIDGAYRGKAITFRNPTTTNKPIKIGGGYQNGHTYDWKGGIADFRVYDHCLIDSDIERIRKNNKKMLQVWFPFNKDSRNVGLERTKISSYGAFSIESDKTGFKCAKFGPSEGHISIKPDAFMENTEMSMTFSVNFNSWNSERDTPIGISANPDKVAGNTFTFFKDPRRPFFYFNTSNGKTYGSTNTGDLLLNTWYHFACVYKRIQDGGIMTLYQNGVLIETFSTPFVPTFESIKLALVGASGGKAGQTDSKMSNVRFYNLALTYEDVQRIYNNEEIIILPSEYEKLEYIQSTGTQYIDTGINGFNSGDWEIYCEWMSVAAPAQSYGYIFGVYEGENYNSYRLIHKTTSTTEYYVSAKSKAGGGSILLSNVALNAKHSIKIKNETFTCDGVSYTASTTGTSLPSANTMLLFKSKNNLYSKCRIYSTWAKKDGILKYNMIPAKRKSDNVIGMYDMVSKQFFTNSGTGSFTGA